MTLGSIIRTARTDRGWTLFDTAVNCGVQTNTIQNAEKGRALSLPSLRALAAGLGLELGLLVEAPPGHWRAS